MNINQDITDLWGTLTNEEEEVQTNFAENLHKYLLSLSTTTQRQEEETESIYSPPTQPNPTIEQPLLPPPHAFRNLHTKLNTNMSKGKDLSLIRKDLYTTDDEDEEPNNNENNQEDTLQQQLDNNYNNSETIEIDVEGDDAGVVDHGEEQQQEEDEYNNKKTLDMVVLETNKKNRKKDGGYRRKLKLKKTLKDGQIIEKEMNIIAQKDNDIIIYTYNRYNELKYIFEEKEKNLKIINTTKDALTNIELIESRFWCEAQKLVKRKSNTTIVKTTKKQKTK